jgi:glucose/arabinose dehydrogenase
MLRIFIFLFFSILVLYLTHFLSFSDVYGNSLINQSNNYTTDVFECETYASILHCDLFKNAFEGNGTTHKSEQIINITRDPSYVKGKFDKAIEFHDYYREYIEIPKNNLYNSSQFSVSFWVKKISGSDQQNPNAHVVSFLSRDHRYGWFFETNSSDKQSIDFGISNKLGNITTTKAVPISNSSFTNIAATFNGSSINVYKDGNLFDTLKYHGNYSAANDIPIHIGSAAYCNACNLFTGIVDDVRIYNRVIDSDEIKKLYLDSVQMKINNSNSTIDKNLIGHWTFDNTLKDLSATKNPGQMFTLIASMVSSPDGRIFISEKNTGKIVILKDNKLLDKPFVTINDSYINWEQGLLGLAIDPHFIKNHFVYLYYTAINDEGNPINRVVRFTDEENKGNNMTTILDNIPASHGYHSGGAMTFGPDGKLYITVGDATEHIYAQTTSTILGKVLRINSDGSIPKDNPFPGSPIYTLGHRNMFGIAFDNKSKMGIVTENGDVLYDEVNILHKGGNYGFPTLQPANINPQLSNSSLDIKPIRTYWHPIGPTQAIYYTGNTIPILKNTFVFGTFTGHIYSMKINNVTDTIDSEQSIFVNHYPFESVIGITQTPSGDLYYGSFHVYKLISVLDSQQIVFPLILNHSKDVVIDDLRANTGKFVAIDLHFTNSTYNPNNVTQSLKIKIPKQVINNIKNINANVILANGQTIQKTIPISLDNKSINYNVYTIPIINGGNKFHIIIYNSNLTSNR